MFDSIGAGLSSVSLLVFVVFWLMALYFIVEPFILLILWIVVLAYAAN